MDKGSNIIGVNMRIDRGYCGNFFMSDFEIWHVMVLNQAIWEATYACSVIV